jgi:hypothetical protein
MTLPSMPAQIVSREFLRVAGGYGAPEQGASPAGGLDIDHAGNLAADGAFTVGGSLDLHGPLQNTTGDLTLESPLRLGAGGVNKLWSAWLLPETASKSPTDAPGGPTSHWSGNFNGAYTSLDFDPTIREFAAWSIPLPADYDGSELAATLYWTADSGTIGHQVVWRVHLICVGDSETLHAALSPLPGGGDAYQGASMVHAITQTGIPANPSSGGLLQVNVNRQSTHADDTLSADSRLIAVHIAYS